jgi:hypothetical protein
VLKDNIGSLKSEKKRENYLQRIDQVSKGCEEKYKAVLQQLKQACD